MKTLAACLLLALCLVPSASGFEGGGRKPSEAPLIEIGHHYAGQLNNHRSDANYGGTNEVAFWKLPPLTSRDVVTVDWHALPFTHYSSFPVCLILAQGIDDFSWGSVFGSTASYECSEDGPEYGLSGSGSAHTAITVQANDATASYLEFTSEARATEPSSLETYPYDFTVEPILHYLGVALAPREKVPANGTLRASATLADGSPAPDGLSFDLAAKWNDGGTASYSAVSSGGSIAFPLALPETAIGKRVTFVASHFADSQYEGASSPRLVLTVKPPKNNAAACERAKRHAHALARQYRRLQRRAAGAHGATRRRLRRRARRSAHALRVARAEAGRLCGAA